MREKHILSFKTNYGLKLNGIDGRERRRQQTQVSVADRVAAASNGIILKSQPNTCYHKQVWKIISVKPSIM